MQFNNHFTSKKKKKSPCKVLVLVGDEVNDTQYANHVFGEFLRQKLSLNVQRVSGTQHRTQNLMKQMAESSQHTSVKQNQQIAQNLAQKMFKFDITDSTNESKPNQESQQGSKLKKTQKLIFFEDIDTIFEDEKSEQFYGQLAKLIYNSKVPIVASCYQKKDEAELEFLDHICDGSLNGLGVDIPYERCDMRPILKVPCELNMILKLIQTFERTFDNESIVKAFRTNKKDMSSSLSAFLEQLQESFGEGGRQNSICDESQAHAVDVFAMMNHLQLSGLAGSHGVPLPKQQRQTYEYDDIRNLHGFQLEQWDSVSDLDDADDVSKLADRLDDLSMGTDLKY